MFFPLSNVMDYAYATQKSDRLDEKVVGSVGTDALQQSAAGYERVSENQYRSPVRVIVNSDTAIKSGI